jgi:hypothetical protein
VSTYVGNKFVGHEGFDGDTLPTLQLSSLRVLFVSNWNENAPDLFIFYGFRIVTGERRQVAWGEDKGDGESGGGGGTSASPINIPSSQP